ncbi:hypothetical protein X741_30125 [Mesorhizobium sp. LNHC229A00]|nr:hypothetical protein X741_30125 [Mesorhizobium sp. LNHC229A00]
MGVWLQLLDAEGKNWGRGGEGQGQAAANLPRVGKVAGCGFERRDIPVPLII